MFKNPVLFHQFGISWTVVKTGLVAGTLLMVLAAVLFTALFKHVGAKTRKLTPSESQHVAFYPGEMGIVEDVHGITWGGVAAELTWNIDTLRKAARRGDWFVFWVYPVMSSCWIIGFGLVLLTGMIAARFPLGMALVIGLCSLMLGVNWFMSWAAIYTKIDAGAEPDETPPAIGPRR
jgi:hypothetical protein